MQSEFDLKSLINLMIRQSKLVFLVTFFVVSLVGIVSLVLTPKYVSTALVLVDTSSKDLLAPQDGRLDAMADNVRVLSEVEIFNSDQTFLQVIQEQDLIGDDEYGFKPGWREQLYSLFGFALPNGPASSQILGLTLEEFRDAVRIERNGLTNLIAVQVVSRDADKAAILSNALTASYIRKQVESKISRTIAARDIIQRRVTEASLAIVDSEKKFDSFISDNLARLEGQVGTAGLKMLREQMAKLDEARAEQAAKLQLVQNGLQNNDMALLVRALDSEKIAELGRQRASLSADLAQVADGDSATLQLREQLKAIDSTLAAEASTEVDALEKQVNESEARGDEIRQQLRAKVMDGNMPPEILTEIYGLQQSAEIARRQYQSLLGRLQDLNAQADLQVADSRVVSPGLPSPKPAFPDHKLFLGLGLIVGLGLSSGLAILREHFIGGFTDEEQVEDVLKVSLAASVPMQKPELKKSLSLASFADLIKRSRMSAYSEAFRRLRIIVEQNVPHRPLDEPKRATVIMVSSSNPSEGKTTLSISLARTYDLAGKKTLLIDCDLRRPSIDKQMNVAPEFTLLEYLRGESSPKSLSKLSGSDPMSNMTVFFGRVPGEESTAELFTGARLKHLLTAAKQHFDYIIVDTPPVEPVVDALYIAPQADIILYVVKWASTSQKTAKKTIAALRASSRPETKIVAVLNEKAVESLSTAKGYDSYYTN